MEAEIEAVRQSFRAEIVHQRGHSTDVLLARDVVPPRRTQR